MASIAVVCMLCMGLAAGMAEAKPIKRAAAEAPAPPQGLVAAAIDPGVSLDWLPGTDTSVSGYYVYLKFNKHWKKMTRTPLADNHYYDPEGVAGDVYAVSAVDSSGLESAYAEVLAQPATAVFYQEDHPSVSLQGMWMEEYCPAAQGGGLLASGDAAARMEFRFTGSQVKLITARDNTCGSANIYLDGNFVSTVNLFSPDPLYQQIEVSLPGLPREEHVLTILVLGYGNPVSASSYIVVDAFEVR